MKENGATQLALYAYDDLGRRATITRASTADQTTYGYDGASRLTSLTHNIASTANDVTFTLARNAAVSGGYDARGNLTFDGTRTLTYDVENRLLSVTGSPGMSLAYDPLGRLHQTTAGGTVTQFLYSGDELSAEYDGSGALLRRYVQGPGVDEPVVWYEGSGTTDKRWLHADMRGSVIFTANASGTLTYGPYKYGSYGEPASWSGSRFSYTGQIMLPEAKLYHYKARAYDPATGRFMQTDPVGYDAGDFNLYRYIQDDPVNATDPIGKESATPTMYSVCSMTGGASCGSPPGTRARPEFVTTYTRAGVSAVPGVGAAAGMGTYETRSTANGQVTESGTYVSGSIDAGLDVSIGGGVSVEEGKAENGISVTAAGSVGPVSGSASGSGYGGGVVGGFSATPVTVVLGVEIRHVMPIQAAPPPPPPPPPESKFDDLLSSLFDWGL